MAPDAVITLESNASIATRLTVYLIHLLPIFISPATAYHTVSGISHMNSPATTAGNDQHPTTLSLLSNRRLPLTWALNRDKRTFPSRPSFCQETPKNPVRRPCFGPLDAQLVDAKLMPQCQILALQLRARLQRQIDLENW